MKKNILFAVLSFLVVIYAGAQTPTILIDGEEVLTTNMTSGAPYWLSTGQTLAPGNHVKFISVMEYNVAPAQNGGNTLQFNHVISVSSVSTIPSNTVWKIEAVALDPSVTFGSADNLGNHVATNHLTMSGFRINELGSPIAENDAVNVGTSQSGGLIYSADSGTANAYMVNLSIPPAGYMIGMSIHFKAANSNTGASTLNVNSLGTVSIKKQGGSANLDPGDIASGQMVSVIYDGANFQMNSQLGNAAGGSPHGQQRFTGNGSFTVPEGVYTVYLTMAGGGGGGGGYVASGGGGASVVLNYPINVTPFEVVSVTVGAGGTSGTGNVNGNAGGSSSFGSYFTTGGGGGGKYGGGNPGGSGGTGSSGSVAGGSGLKGSGNTGGAGGGSLFGMGGLGGYDTNGTPGIGYGGGGAGGGYNCCQSGGSGAPGIVIVEW